MKASTSTAAIALLALGVVPLTGRASVSFTTVNGIELIVERADGRAAQRARAPERTSVRRPADLTQALLPGAESLLEGALALVGTPYVWGGSSPRGFDCSGLTWYLFKQLGITIPRTADLQFAAGRLIAGDPLPGDLVFFQTYDYGASHVGIYLGGGHFVNSIGADVHVTSFASNYFSGRYLGARRFLPD